MRPCISQSRNLATSQSRTEWRADSHINLRKDQFLRLKCSGAPVSRQIYAACERYAAGDLALPQIDTLHQNSSFVAVHVKKRPDYPDAVIRDILDAHFAAPVNHRAEIAKLDAEIEAMFPKGEYILENRNEE